MADQIQPVSRPVGKADGISSPSSYSTLTTPEPAMGRYYGSGEPAKNAVGSGSIMGKKNKK